MVTSSATPSAVILPVEEMSVPTTHRRRVRRADDYAPRNRGQQGSNNPRTNHQVMERRGGHDEYVCRPRGMDSDNPDSEIPTQWFDGRKGNEEHPIVSDI